MRRSRSLDHLDLDLEHDSVAEKSATEVDAAPTTAAAPTRTSLHHKSESLGQASVFSGTVFTSDQEVSIDEGKSPNAELTSLSDVSNRRSNSLEDLVMGKKHCYARSTALWYSVAVVELDLALSTAGFY